MTDWLRQRLGFSAQGQAEANHSLARLKTVSTFLSDAIDSIKDSNAIKAIAESTPWWAEATGIALAEAVPPVKFAITLFEKLTEQSDPQVLGLIACTLAYERSIEEAMTGVATPTQAKQVGASIKGDLKALDTSAAADFSNFSLRTALSHAFTTDADAVFEKFLQAVGYGETERRILLNHVHRRFVSNLKTILSDRKLRKRFEPFAQLMSLGTEEERAYNAVLNHVELQRWLFEDAPVLGKEPFALLDVYIATECGAVLWSDIKAGSDQETSRLGDQQRMNDPFTEQCGGRHDLLETVIAYLANPNFNDAIVIQGTAGSGKSSFTLKLSALLQKEGLYPIRIRLRDLPLDRPIKDGISKAMFPPDHRLPEHSRGQSVEDPFRGGLAFEESTTFRGTTICPYVLILDGWDEINISASEGFKVRVARMLDQVRLQFLEKAGVRVRVILTGRPSTAVSESLFLRERTPLLTIRPIRPDQLVSFVGALRVALERSRIEPEGGSIDSWSVPSDAEFEKVFARYKTDYELNVGVTPHQEPSNAKTASLSVLGLPLLAHLAVRLIAQYEGNRIALVENPTTLYRSMVDLTCAKGGKPIEEEMDIEGRQRVTGAKLRALLQRTAAAMTMYGEESISFEELSLRLDLREEELNRDATELSEHHVLTSLMISFFFKGGQLHLGCEFLHKSFREYLFAEGIVEALKEFGRSAQGSLPQRSDYWKDFEESSPQYSFARRLSELLSPQWLSPEVIAHLEELVPWEVARTFTAPSDASSRIASQGTPGLKAEEWAVVRDGLSDVWHWWGEGAHLRPQPMIDRRTRAVTFLPSFAEELVELDAPRDRTQRHRPIHPARTVTMDAHLGDGLFRLCSLVHYGIAVNTGWLTLKGSGSGCSAEKLWSNVSAVGKGPRKCQSQVEHEGRSWTLFAPSGDDPRYFIHYSMRIGAAGWRPAGVFPQGLDARGVDLRGSTIAMPFIDTPLRWATKWVHANLSQCVGILGFFGAHDFSEVFAEGAQFEGAIFAGASFRYASLQRAHLSYSLGNWIDFTGADLSGVDAEDVWWPNSVFEASKLSGTKFKNADLEGATGTDFFDASGEYVIENKALWSMKEVRNPKQ